MRFVGLANNSELARRFSPETGNEGNGPSMLADLLKGAWPTGDTIPLEEGLLIPKGSVKGSNWEEMRKGGGINKL